MKSNPTFQHRHYAEIAALIANQRSPANIIEAFVDMFAKDNDRFDVQRFRAAAMGTPSNRKYRRVA